jgi:hypothetical protein
MNGLRLARALQRDQDRQREEFHGTDHKTRLRDVDPFGVAQDKLAGKFLLRQGLWIED